MVKPRKSCLKKSDDFSIVGFPKLSEFLNTDEIESKKKRTFRISIISQDDDENDEIFLNAIVDSIMIHDDAESGRIASATLRSLASKLSQYSKDCYVEYLKSVKHVCYFNSVKLWFEKASTEIVLEIKTPENSKVEHLIGSDYCIHLINGTETKDYIERIESTLNAVCGNSVIKCVHMLEQSLWIPEDSTSSPRNDFESCNRFMKHIAAACRHLNDLYPGIREFTSYDENLRRSLIFLKRYKDTAIGEYAISQIKNAN